MKFITVHPVQEHLSISERIQQSPPPKYAQKSFGIFDLNSKIRKWLINLVHTGSSFDSFILIVIVLNSLSMACIDYNVVNEHYEPISEGSWRNKLIENLEIVFILIFFMEFLAKSIAFGFVNGADAYLRDNWNRFDFIILLFSIFSMIPIIPNLSTLRSFRVLRPLRSVAKLPGLKKIISALVDSMGALSNVMVLLTFLLVCFSITGVLFWNGLLHARCRLTPFPVRMSNECRWSSDVCWDAFLKNVTHDPQAYRCLPEDNDDVEWTQGTSPWFLKGPQDCVWPIDENDERVCSLSNTGSHLCHPRHQDNGDIVYRTCGSNYDSFGNPRFINTIEPYGYPRMNNDNFIESLNWGFTNFDSFLPAFITTFQVITLEGWTSVMYQVSDAWHYIPTVIIFSIEVVLCGYIALNLVLAVISNSLDEFEMKEENITAQSKSSHQQSNETNNKFKNLLQGIAKSEYYSTFIFFCILLNTVILSMDYYGISDERADFLEMSNMIFTVIFLVDVLIMNIVLGFREYWRDPFNFFDGTIGVVSLMELLIDVIFINGSTGQSSFSALRSMRLFRIFKMAKRWKSLQSLLRTVADSIQEVGNFAILLILFMMIYSLVGMQLLSNRLHFSPESGATIGIAEPGYNEAIIPRSHFDHFLWSMVTVFQLLSGENWNSVMYDGWKASGWVAVFYFVSLVVIGVFIVMNLFLAILLKIFENNDDLAGGKRIEDSPFGITENEGVVAPIKRPSAIQILWFKLVKNNPMRKICFAIVESYYFESLVTLLIILSSLCLVLDNPLADPNSNLVKALKVLDFIFTIVFMIEMFVKIFAYGLYSEKDAYLKSPWNILDFILVMVSILNLADIGPGSAVRSLRVLRVLRPLKMINRLPGLKVVVDALLLSFPSVAEVAVLCALFFLIFASFGVNFLKGTFYHCDGTIFDSLSAEQRAYIVNPFEWGRLNSTEKTWFDNDIPLCVSSSWVESTIPTSKEVCDCLAPGEWVQVIPQNFDNIFQGMALLFEISTTEGWVDVMYAAIDQRGVEKQPLRDSNPIWALFFIIFLVIGAFFVLELFVGVTIDNFNKIREKTGRGLMTESQKQWATTQAFIMRIKPEKRIQRPIKKMSAWCYDFVMPQTNPRFGDIITICIILNSLCTAMVSFDDSERKVMILDVLNFLFTIIFTLELILKIIAMRMKYFYDGWNRFDFILVCGSNIGLIVETIFDSKSFTSALRLFRICRLFRLIRSFQNLRTLFNTMVMSIPSIGNIGVLLLLVFFIYAIIGIQLFSFIPNNEEVNEITNFRSFRAALKLLLRFSTGENWNGFMRSIIPSTKDCDPNPIYNPSSPWCLQDDEYECTHINGCGAGLSAYIYFYSFTLLVTFVILNLFVGVVLEAFEKSSEGDILSVSDLDDLTKAWVEFDPEATWYIKAMDVKHLIRRLSPPLGIGSESTREETNEMMNDKCLMDIPVNADGKVHIVHVARQLVKRLAIMKQGDEFHELGDDHPLEKKLSMTKMNAKKTLNEINLERSRKKMAVLRAFVRAYRNNEKLSEVT